MFGGRAEAFFEDPVFAPSVTIDAVCNDQTGEVEWTATADNSGSNVAATVVISIDGVDESPTTVNEDATETYNGTTTTGVTVTITMTNTDFPNDTATDSASFTESCEAFNPVVTVDVVCSLATGDVTWTASANNGTSTVAGSVVITVGDTAQDAVEVAAGSSDDSFSGDTSADVTVTITMSNTDFPDDSATASDIHEGDCIPVFEPTVTVDVTCTESNGTVNWVATVANSTSTVDGTIVVSGTDDVAIENSTVGAYGSWNNSGGTEVGETITVTASAEGFDDVSASDLYEGTCDPPATTTTATTTTTTTTTVAPPETFPATGVDETRTLESLNTAMLSIGFGALVGGVALFARRRIEGGQK